MCHKNEWMIEDRFPLSRVEVAKESEEGRAFREFYPTYWLYCGNCGFVAQFARSIVGGEENIEPEEPSSER